MVAVLSCGCAAVETAEPPAHPPYTQQPIPSGAAVAPPPASTAAAPDCGDPTASLRPFPPGETPASPALDRIRERGRLVVGLDTSSNLFSFLDPATGTIEGFDVDIAREVARDLFGDPQRVDFRVVAAKDRVPALQAGTVDIVVETMTVTCERRAQIAFSTVYFEARQRVLAMRGSGVESAADLDGRRVCTVVDTTNLQHIQQVQPAATVVTVQNWADCLVVLQQRQVDAVTTDDSILAGLAVQDPNLEIVGPGFSYEPYGVGVNKADTDLVRHVNGTLERIRTDGTWQRIHERWLNVLGPPPPPPTPRYED
ncbi:glutamate ABC transporter substrate-binding protein [Rhodococcus olei]|uniref:Glutamate ABC transporter substrate-binding protein n=1 Tax=Rhodococcus olei TaxID=2161675 RepID=A0ABP8PGR9_9NOCA